jgi:hypothetical protein
MIRFIRAAIWVMLVFAGIRVSAQVNDAGLWMDVNIEKKITRSLAVEFTEEVKMYENITEVGTIYSDLGLTYNFMKRFRVGGSVRFTNQKRLDDTYDSRFSYYFDFSFREKVKLWIFNVRLRYQSQFTDMYTSENGTIPKNVFRPKATIKYEINKHIRPEASAELFFLLNGQYPGSFVQWRASLGVEYVINRRNSVELYYMLKQEVNVNNPWTSYIIGLSYSYSF